MAYDNTYTTQWKFLIDLDGDGLFANPLDDVTAYVKRANWNVGRHQPWQLMSDPLTANITLENKDKRFSPENSASPLYPDLQPFRRVQIQAGGDRVVDNSGNQVDDNSGNRVISAFVPKFMGFLNAVAPTFGTHSGPFEAALTCVGIETFLKSAVTNGNLLLPLLQDVYAPDIFNAILALTQYPPGTPTSTMFDDGVLLYPYVGDNWDKFASAWDGLSTVTSAEWGPLYTNESGALVFWNRHHTQYLRSTLGTFDAGAFQGMSYAYGDDILNDARVTTYPRTLGSPAGDLIWQLDSPLVFSSNEAKPQTARWIAADGKEVSAINVVTPNFGDGSLVEQGGYTDITVSAFTVNARGATFTLTNTGKKQRTLTTCNIIGQTLTSWSSVEIDTTDPTSMTNYGHMIYRADSRLLSDSGTGGSIGQYLVTQRKDPHGRVKAVHILNKDATLLGYQQTWMIGDNLTVTEGQTATNGRYTIVGTSWNWDASGHKLSVDFALEPVPNWLAGLVGIPGRSNVGVSTICGF